MSRSRYRANWRRVRRAFDQEDRVDRIEGAASGKGHHYKRNGRSRFSWRAEDLHGPPQSCLARFADMYRVHSMILERYKVEGRCTEKQLETIYALYIEGTSLQEHARQCGVSASAIGSRIDALANKAPEFCRWWRTLHTGRSRKRKNGGRAASR